MPFLEEALEWLVGQNNIHVVNLSLELFGSSNRVKQLITQAFEQKMVLVAAATSIEDNKVTLPARLRQCIAVGSVSTSGGELFVDALSLPIINKIDVLAPGKDIWSTSNVSGEYRLDSGSSMAAAFVSGVVALLVQKMAQKNQPLDPATIRNLIRQTADDIPDTEGNLHAKKLLNPTALLAAV